MTHEPDRRGTAERYEYFMVRVTRSTTEPDRIAGLVERLGSGQKRSFDTGEQLVRLVGSGFNVDLNMQSGVGDRNPVATDLAEPPPHDAV